MRERVENAAAEVVAFGGMRKFPVFARGVAVALLTFVAAATRAGGATFYSLRFLPGTGGAGTMRNASFEAGAAGTLPACTFYRTGYGFSGWSRAGSATVDYVDRQTVRGLSSIPGARLDLVAQWTPNTYTVRFHANGGSGSMAAQQFVYDVPQALAACAFSRADHVFAGWATSASGKAVYKNKATVSNLTAANGGAIDLYATWEETINRNLVACMGDSITQGYNCAGAPYPSRIASLTGKSVLNYGVAGQTSAYGKSIVSSVLARHPGTVTVFFGANDVHGHDVSWTVSNLRATVRSIKASGARAIVATPLPQRGNWASYNSKISELASAVRSMAASEGVTCVDLHSAFGSGAGYIQSDGLHLTDAGGALVARKFADAL